MMSEQSQVAAEMGTDWKDLKKRIEHAVQRGDMTREDANAQYKAIRERLGKPLGNARMD